MASWDPAFCFSNFLMFLSSSTDVSVARRPHPLALPPPCSPTQGESRTLTADWLTHFGPEMSSEFLLVFVPFQRNKWNLLFQNQVHGPTVDTRCGQRGGCVRVTGKDHRTRGI